MQFATPGVVVQLALSRRQLSVTHCCLDSSWSPFCAGDFSLWDFSPWWFFSLFKLAVLPQPAWKWWSERAARPERCGAVSFLRWPPSPAVSYQVLHNRVAFYAICTGCRPARSASLRGHAVGACVGLWDGSVALGVFQENICKESERTNSLMSLWAGGLQGGRSIISSP